MNQITRIPPALRPPAPRVASAQDLIAEINAQSAAVRTISATLDMQPSEGSVYSGVIKQYHDVRGFVLAKRPAWIRMEGQAPVVGTDIFDMASDGQRFSLYIPSQNKFYEGEDTSTVDEKASLKALRPEFIVEALFLRPLNPATASYFVEESEEGTNQRYVVGVLGSCGLGEVPLKRKIWFDRSNMQIVREQFYGQEGKYLEDIHFGAYVNFGTIRYPTRISIERPANGVSLGITILNAKFNQPIPQSRFLLQKPSGARLVELGSPGASDDR